MGFGADPSRDESLGLLDLRPNLLGLPPLGEDVGLACSTTLCDLGDGTGEGALAALCGL